ncbi:putative head-tail adaptor [Pantoea phage vB_PagS_MED16]|nr:putative head-tail adaptor [Pantoea phage vB_PagS_MED16]
MIGTVQGLIDYAAARGVTVDELLAPVWLTRASDYLSRMCWIGKPVDPLQDGPWPRKWLDEDGIELSGTPPEVTTASYRLAMAVGEGVDLEPITSGKQITKAAISGAVSVEYDINSIGAGPDFPWWDSLVGGWLKCEESGGINFDVFRG